MYEMKDARGSGGPGPGKTRMKALLFFLLIVILLVPASVLVLQKAAEALGTHNASSLPSPSISPSSELFPIACNLLPEARERENALFASAPDGSILKYTIDPRLQNEMQSYLNTTAPPYALFIAIEPSTGRILAMNSSSREMGWGLDAFYRLFPMASLFKMVTASAALEKALINPSTEISYRGRAVSENPNNWDITQKKGGHSMNVTEAMGRSVNPVYGKIASDMLGRDALMATCDIFGFNRQLFREIPVQPSQANIEGTQYGLRLSGSGLDHELKVSPLHAALITAAFANKGVMLSPRLVESVTANGKELKTNAAVEMGRIVKPRVAEELTSMLVTTVTTGTSAKAFRTHDARRLSSVMKVAAKTGTLNGDNPSGQHTWFAAYAPAENPKIAVLSLIINDDRWKIKASNVGEHALTTYFSNEIAAAPAPVAVKKVPVKRAAKHNVRKKSSEKSPAKLKAKKTNRVKNDRHQAARKKTVRSSHRGKGG